MKKIHSTILLLFFIFFQISSRADELNVITDASQITYDWLVKAGKEAGYSDHIPHFRRIFGHYKAKKLLEFGLGFSTKYFLDHCDKVISVEFITHGYGPDWMRKTLELYKNCPNWIPIAYFSGYTGNTHWAPHRYFGSDSVYEAASYQCTNHRSYASINGFYLVELEAFIRSLCKDQLVDIAFVDPGLYLRGDLVQLLFGKVDVIVAHDTQERAQKVENDVYGYSAIVTPDDYEEILIPRGMTTTVWIRKTDILEPLINSLKDYAK